MSSPSCAALKASQQHHKPTHPTSRSPLRSSPQNALAPARRCCPPNTISLQTTPQSHKCEPADARVSSKHSSPSRIHLPHSMPQHITPHPCMPQHRSTPSHTACTPKNTHHHHNQSNWRTPLHASRIRGKRATQTRAHIPSTHKHPHHHTTRARTPPAVTITTPELSPDTATGVSRFVDVPSPTCAVLKASQPHHKPAHPASRFPPPPLPTTRPRTCP